MIRAMTPALAFALLTAPLSAQDERLMKLDYDPQQVVRIEGKAGVQATIAFADDEVIENVAIGDSQKWQVTPNKRATLLFVKPLTSSAVTNMTVVTSRRTYLFDLVASPRAKPLYILRFSYPEDETKVQAEIAEGPNDAELAAAQGTERIVDPADLNFAWSGSGDARLLPARSYDDGVMTYLAWPQGSAIPAILVTDYKGTEGPVNFTVRDDVIVVDGVPREIVLRSGKDMARLVNTGPERASSDDARPNGRADGALAANLENR